MQHHQGKEPCQVFQTILENKRAGLEVISWGRTQLRLALVPILRSPVSYSMNNSQLTMEAIEGYWAPRSFVVLASWVAHMAWVRFCPRLTPQNPKIVPLDQKLPPQSGSSKARPCNEERAFLRSFSFSMMKLPDDERLLRLTELEILGPTEFRHQFWDKVYPGVPPVK